jgi:hypothetical protein
MRHWIQPFANDSIKIFLFCLSHSFPFQTISSHILLPCGMFFWLSFCFLVQMASFLSNSFLNRFEVMISLPALHIFLGVSLWWLPSRSSNIFFKNSAVCCPLVVYGVRMSVPPSSEQAVSTPASWGMCIICDGRKSISLETLVFNECRLWIQHFANVNVSSWTQSRDNSVGTAMGYRVYGRNSIPDRGKWFFSAPQRPDRLWGPPSLLQNRCPSKIPDSRLNFWSL